MIDELKKLKEEKAKTFSICVADRAKTLVSVVSLYLPVRLNILMRCNDDRINRSILLD